VNTAARFLSVTLTKTGKTCAKEPTNIPNGHKFYQNVRKIGQMAIEQTNLFNGKALKNLPVFPEIWFENIPSGNPEGEQHACQFQCPGVRT
jgi:hypothetical protein